jgi:hypothetical protein
MDADLDIGTSADVTPIAQRRTIGEDSAENLREASKSARVIVLTLSPMRITHCHVYRSFASSQ